MHGSGPGKGQGGLSRRSSGHGSAFRGRHGSRLARTLGPRHARHARALALANSTPTWCNPTLPTTQAICHRDLAWNSHPPYPEVRADCRYSSPCFHGTCPPVRSPGSPTSVRRAGARARVGARLPPRSPSWLLGQATLPTRVTAAGCGAHQRWGPGASRRAGDWHHVCIGEPVRAHERTAVPAFHACFPPSS